MTKKKIGWIISLVIVCLVALSLMIWSIVLVNINNNKKQKIELIYERAVYEASDSLNNAEIDLSKLLISDSDKENIHLLSDISRHAESAQISLNNLPISQESEIKISKFLGQLADWSRCYHDKIVNNDDTKSYNKQIEQLYILARELNQDVKTLLDKLDDGKLVDSLKNSQIFDSDFEGLFTSHDTQSVEYPSLIYDGPFSDSKEVKYSHLDGLEEIDEERAYKICHDLLKMDDVKLEGHSQGDLKTFEFSGVKEGTPCYVSISVHGGLIVNYTSTRKITANKINRKTAEKFAVEGAKKLGYPNMKAVWYNSYDGIGYVNLAPYENDVIFYCDLVKVNVAMDNGEILGLESSSFCKCNKQREDLIPTINEKTAKSMVSKKIAITNVRLCVIPKNENEFLCYEVAGEYKGLDYFVYIDAKNGETVNILRVVNDGQGSLTL